MKEADKVLAGFSVDSAKLSKTGRFLPQTTFTLKVTNGTEIPVKRVFFEGVYKSPERSIPWAADEFNYSISGGLEPGESATWRLTPSMLSEFYGVGAETGAVFEVRVVDLEGMEGRIVGYSGADLDDLRLKADEAEGVRNSFAELYGL